MIDNNNIYYNEDRNKIEKANRLEALENMVENHTRTERHLEQYSNISSLEKYSESIIKQSEREGNIEILESKILSGGQKQSNELDGLQKNYALAKGYMENNRDHMDYESLKNMQVKQQNRRDEINELS